MKEPVIWIANDHGGYELKKHFLDYFVSKGIPYFDLGCNSTDIVRYPRYASRIATAVSTGEASKGILICSTGIGMSIVANRYPGVRAGLCTSTYMARMNRAHNDGNLLCIGGMITGKLEALDILDTWLNTSYEGGRHDISLGLLKDVEKAVFRENLPSPDEYIDMYE